MLGGLGLRVWGLGFRVWGLGGLGAKGWVPHVNEGDLCLTARESCCRSHCNLPMTGVIVISLPEPRDIEFADHPKHNHDSELINKSRKQNAP